MPTPQPIVSEAAPAAVGPYVHAVRHGDVLYCSGSLPLDPATGELLEAVCASAGTSLDRALRMTIFTTRLDGFAEINEAYAGAFPGNVPARTTVGVAALPKDARVEIDAIVAIGGGDE
jgi:2-iminobutanoate/2-iminopropanoate deaminase